MKTGVSWLIVILLCVNLWTEYRDRKPDPAPVVKESKPELVASPDLAKKNEAKDPPRPLPPSAEFQNLQTVGIDTTVYDSRGVPYRRGIIIPGLGVVEEASVSLVVVRRWDGERHYIQACDVPADSLAGQFAVSKKDEKKQARKEEGAL